MKATANYFVINILILLVEWINTDMRTLKIRYENTENFNNFG